MRFSAQRLNASLNRRPGEQAQRLNGRNCQSVGTDLRPRKGWAMTCSLTPAQRSLRARMGQASACAKYGRHKMTEAARAANTSSDAYWLAKFEQDIDPDRLLSEDERRIRAGDLKLAHFAGLAMKSAAARRERSHSRPKRVAHSN